MLTYLFPIYVRVKLIYFSEDWRFIELILFRAYRSLTNRREIETNIHKVWLLRLNLRDRRGNEHHRIIISKLRKQMQFTNNFLSASVSPFNVITVSSRAKALANHYAFVKLCGNFHFSLSDLEIFSDCFLRKDSIVQSFTFNNQFPKQHRDNYNHLDCHVSFTFPVD